MDELSKYVTISEASKALGINEVNIRKHIAHNRFIKGVHCKKLGSTWIFKKEAIKSKYDRFPITLSERQAEYNKDNYPNMVESEDICEVSSLLGFIPDGNDLENCPMLVFDSYIVLGIFRGYYITDITGLPSGNKVIPNISLNGDFKCISDFKNITDLINFILVGSGVSERYFTKKELEIIKLWINESVDIYGCDWEDLRDIEIGPSID